MIYSSDLSLEKVNELASTGSSSESDGDPGYTNSPYSYQDEGLNYAKRDESLIRDLCSFGGIYLIKRYVHHMENSGFFKAWNNYLDTDGNDRHEVIQIISNGLTDFIIDDARLKMTIAFLEGIYLNSYIGDLKFMSEMLDRALNALHERISSALEQSLLDVSFETVVSSAKPDLTYEPFLKNETYRVVRDGPNYGIKLITTASSKMSERNARDTVSLNSISIFDLAKYIYFKALGKVKQQKSEKLVERMFQEGTRKLLPESVINTLKGKSINQCKALLKRMIINERDEHVVIMKKLLLAAEDIVSTLWGLAPDLKPNFDVKYTPLCEALDEVLESRTVVSSASSTKSTTKIFSDEDVLVDGSTVYLKCHDTSLGKELPELFPAQAPDISSGASSNRYAEADEFDPDEPDWPQQMKGMFRLPSRKKIDLQAHLISTIYSEHAAFGRPVDLRNKYVEFSFLLEEKAATDLPHTVASFFPVERSEIDEGGVKGVSLNYVLKDRDLSEDILAKSTKITYTYEGQPSLCVACGFLIPQNTGVRCFGETWHYEHLVCATCNTRLVDCVVALHRGIPMCIPHYLAVKSCVCSSCHRIIFPHQDAVLYKGTLFHNEHITCKWCFGVVPSDENCCKFTPR